MLDVKIVCEDKYLPIYQTKGASGADLMSVETVEIRPFERLLVNTGIRVSVPAGYEAQVRPRSGLSSKKGLTLVNAVGTIDSDYTGIIYASMINLSNEPQIIEAGDRIAQLVIAPVVQANFTQVDALEETERGEGGFGSTDLKDTGVKYEKYNHFRFI